MPRYTLGATRNALKLTKANAVETVGYGLDNNYWHVIAHGGENRLYMHVLPDRTFILSDDFSGPVDPDLVVTKTVSVGYQATQSVLASEKRGIALELYALATK